MCEYCDESNYDELNQDRNIDTQRYDLGVLGNLLHNFSITKLPKDEVDDYAPMWSIASEIYFPESDYAEALQVIRAPIKYCPFCGRKLES